MNIAVISFDQELITDISKKLADFEVKGYTDSLSLLREINFFDPDVIIYDASGGELALNALEFFISRDKIKGKPVKVLISKENPIDEATLSRFENLDFYDKDTEINKLVEEIQSGVAELKEAKEEAVPEEDTSAVEAFEESYQPPTDMEALLGESSEASSGEEIDLSSDVGSLEDVNELLKEMETVSTEPPEQNVEPARMSEPEPEPPPPPPPVERSFQSPGNTLRITIELSPEEVRKTVLEIAVEKLIEEIKNDVDIQKIKEDLQKDFFDRLEKELKESIEEIKNSIKERLFESIESDLKEKVRESIKEDVTRITTELVKEKLDQVFGQK